jgi:adenine-specific DNA-methyltransferase
MSTELAAQWADHFGLALAPLFEASESGDPETDNVLLDGGFGSFAMSVAEDPLWRDPTTAAWAWSSNLPHHVTVSEKIVAVRRWDRPKAEEFSRASVDSQIEPFYAYLTSDRVRSTQRVVDHVLQLFRRMRALVADCPSSDSLGHFVSLRKGGSGSSCGDVMPPAGDAASGGWRWSCV